MSKKKVSKKKQETFTQKYKKEIIGIVIILLSIFSFTNAGVFGEFLNNMFRYLFGDFRYFFLLYIIVVTSFVLLKKTYLVFKNKIGIGLNLLTLSMFFYMSSNFFDNKSNVYTIKNMIIDITSDTYPDGTGIIGWLTSFSLIKLIGIIGLNIIILILIVVGIYLIIDINKIREFFKFELFEEEVQTSNQKEKTKEVKSKTKEEKTKSYDEEEIQEDVVDKKVHSNRFFEFPVFKREEKSTPDPLFANESFNINNEQKSSFVLPREDDPIISSYSSKPKVKVIDNQNTVLQDDVLFKNNNQIKMTEIVDTEVVTEIPDVINKEPSPSQEIKTKQVIEEEVIHTENQDIDIPIFMQEKEDVREDIEDIQVSLRQKNYQIPSINLLKGYGDNSAQLAKLKSTAKEKSILLKQTLHSFGLNVEILNIHIGPNVTKYELQPEMGVKVSKFNSLSNDIAMALAASGVRIEAPIPGKAAVGIEIANDDTMMVSLKEVLLSNNNDYDKKLQIGLGKDISGQAIFSDITKTPHLLVAGATGSGKSVCINSIIVSILTKASPDEVKLLMVDPKKVELTPYNGIPHLLAPVVTEPKKAVSNLKQMVAEMEWRYEMFAETNTRNIDGYNTKVSNDPDTHYSTLPYIVIIIDELADLMMVASNEVETSIARLAQMARAAGIHLIIATQRPSTDVITGLIKANIPSRIAFAVSSSIDSRTILDSSGAEKLLGRGDMLLSAQGSNNLHRIQGAFLSDEEVENIVSEIANQFTEEELLQLQDKNLSEAEFVNQINAQELDELYDEVREDVIRTQRASTSQIQRRYKVGYNRAANIMDQLEANGVISENEGTKPRRVLITEEEYED